jgi:hypothetical protein
MATLTSVTPDSPAADILSSLEADGFRVELEPNGIVIVPRSRLTPERMKEIAHHKEELLLLLRCRDAGVQARRVAFASALASTPAPRVPAFLFRLEVPYLRGVCFSCGDKLPQPRFGRCWRCSLAWRLAAQVQIPGDVASALDGAKVCG